MLNTTKKQHILALVMLSLTAFFWGAGFVLNDSLLANYFNDTPILLNAIRFGLSSVLLLCIFAKRIRWNKTNLLYSAIGGVFLFAAFTLQVYGLRLTTPAHSGFFTAAYIVFVPFIAWIAFRKRPHASTFVGVGVAIVGLALLNFNTSSDASGDTIVGDLITLGSALMFTFQIVWSEVSLKKGVDHLSFTTLQMTTASVLFVIFTLTFEHRSYAALTFDWAKGGWQLALVTLCGTAFAYFAQTYSQQHVNSSETALIMGCESPIGAVISLLVGSDVFSWNMLVGGLMVILAVALVEIVPTLGKKKSTQNTQDAPEPLQTDTSDV